MGASLILPVRPVQGADAGGRRRILRARAGCPRAVCHAVIPADAGMSTFRRFAPAEDGGCQTLMLSKTDDAVDPWSLLQAALEMDLRVSCNGAGPRLEDFQDRWSVAIVVAATVAKTSEYTTALQGSTSSAGVASAANGRAGPPSVRHPVSAHGRSAIAAFE